MFIHNLVKIANTVGKSMAFKVARMSESIMESQDDLIIRKSEDEEAGLEDDKQADLYISNQVVVYD